MIHESHPRPARVRRRFVLAATIGASLAAASPAAATPDNTAIPRNTPTNLETILAWYDVTSQAVAAPGWSTNAANQVTASRTWATAWSAANEALDEFAKVRGENNRHDTGARRIAVARAVHDVLLELAPGYTTKANAQLYATQQSAGSNPSVAVADGLAKAAAVKWLASRAYDGLDIESVNQAILPITPSFGVWQPTPPTNGAPTGGGESKGRPFIDPEIAKKVAPQPPANASDAVVADLQEIDKLGGTTPAQTAARGANRTRTARFWAQPSVVGFTPIVRQVLLGEKQTLRQQVKFLSVFHQVTTDLQIATYASKYKYVTWRPITAIRTDDGLPSTPYRANFTPLSTTPLDPEYPSLPVAYAVGAERVFKALVRPIPQGPIVVGSATLPGTLASYVNWSQITDENANSRVWGGTQLRSTGNATRTWATRLAKQEISALGIDPSSKALQP